MVEGIQYLGYGIQIWGLTRLGNGYQPFGRRNYFGQNFSLYLGKKRGILYEEDFLKRYTTYETLIIKIQAFRNSM